MNLCHKISNFTFVSFPATETVPTVLSDGYAPVICNQGSCWARDSGACAMLWAQYRPRSAV